MESNVLCPWCASLYDRRGMLRKRKEIKKSTRPLRSPFISVSLPLICQTSIDSLSMLPCLLLIFVGKGEENDRVFKSSGGGGWCMNAVSRVIHQRRHTSANNHHITPEIWTADGAFAKRPRRTHAARLVSEEEIWGKRERTFINDGGICKVRIKYHQMNKHELRTRICLWLWKRVGWVPGDTFRHNKTLIFRASRMVRIIKSPLNWSKRTRPILPPLHSHDKYLSILTDRATWSN